MRLDANSALRVSRLARVKRALLRGLSLGGAPIAVALLRALQLTGRRAGLALVYHRLDERGAHPDESANPAHPRTLFRAQLQYLVRHYRPVAASEITDAVAQRSRGERFPVAITF